MTNIALVDDEQSILTSVSLSLESEGFTVDTFLNGLDALDAFNYKSYDLGLFDIKMPKMDGNELLTKVRSSKIGKLKDFLPYAEKEIIIDNHQAEKEEIEQKQNEPEKIDKLDELIISLEEEYKPRFEKLSKVLILSHTDDLANDLEKLAIESGNSELIKYASEFTEASLSTDIERIKRSIVQFPRVIQSLSETRNTGDFN